MLDVGSLGKKYGSRWIFRGVEMSVQAGHVLAITGRNGRGKSTLLKTLAGLIEPAEGWIERTDMMGYSALDLHLYPQMTPIEHLQFACSMRSVKFDEEILDYVGMKEERSRQCGVLSTGQRARAKLALAIHHEPELLFLDEPTAALDDAGRAIVGKILADQKLRGGAVMATNDPLDLEHATHELRLAE